MLTKKRLISYVLSIIFAVCILVLVIMLDLNFTIFSKSNFKSKAHSVNYYNRIYDVIMKSCEDDTMQSGFDNSILYNVISTQDVEKDSNRVIDKLYDNWELNIDTSKQRAALNSNIDQFIANKGYQVDDETRADINVYEDTIEDIYVKTISYSKEHVNDIAAQLQKLKKLSKIIIAMMIVLGAILAFAMFKINKPSIGIGMMAAGAILIFVKLYSATTLVVNNILILNRPFSDLVAAIINQVLQHMLVIGIILFVVGIIWTIIFEIRKNYTRMLLLDEHSCIIR
ncbi:MAG: hypothetical protein J6J36_05805 [Clostridia bacterium]|nr:hypothetical protein [Clostridia bacterium]